MHKLFALILLGFVAVLAGCSAESQASFAMLPEGQQFRLTEEPEQLVGILEFRESGEAASDDLVLFGRVGGEKQTWSTTSAEFMLTDPTHAPAEDAHACTSDNCPFCKDKKADNSIATAIVMLTDSTGKVPKVDARRLLPLSEGQVVVVRGPAEINSIGQLVIKARGVYIRE
jgi:hypothetical protein